MKLTLPTASVLGFGLIFSALILAGGVSAQTEPAEIQFPVAELENCKDKAACKAYCDKPENIRACIAFAEKNGLMPKEEIEIAKKFIAAGAKGPGGCSGKEACEAYCDDISHINECVAFAERTGILPPDELQEAKKVQSAIAKGVKPPACRNKKECDVYCEAPENMKECIAFGEAAGFLEGEELQEARKVLAAIEGGLTPPPCRGRDACEAYCTSPDNMESCIAFALAAGLMTGGEVEESKKVLEVIKKGVKPPACRGKEECDAYCAEPGHTDECVQFAVAAGFMTEKEAEMAKRTGGKGPGGCVGKEACEAFCSNPENRLACLEFAKANGMISEEEVRRMEEGFGEARASAPNMPPEVETCLQGVLGGDAFEKLKRGEPIASEEMKEKVSTCFKEMNLGSGQPPRIPQMPPGFEGRPELIGPPATELREGQEQSLYEAERNRIYELERQRIYEAEKNRLMQEGGYPSVPGMLPQGAYPETYGTQAPPADYQSYQQQYQQGSIPTVSPAPTTDPTSSVLPLPMPIESTAPQSTLEKIVDGSLAAVGGVLKKLGF